MKRPDMGIRGFLLRGRKGSREVSKLKRGVWKRREDKGTFHLSLYHPDRVVRARMLRQ